MTTNEDEGKNLLKTEDYQYDEDIENIMPIAEKKSQIIDDDHKQENHNISKKNSNYNSQGLYNDYYTYKTLMNVLTLILLEILLIGTLIFCLSEQKFGNAHESFLPHGTHFRVKFEIFIFIWIIIVVNIFIALLRNSFMFTKDVHEEQEIKYIVTSKLGHSFYIGNLITLITLCLWTNKFNKKYGVNVLLSFLSIIFYLITYVKIRRTKFNGIFNKLGFSVSLSLILAWMSIIFVISMLICIETSYNLSDSLRFWISLGLHLIIFSSTIIILGFYNDVFYVSLILLYQVGIILTNKDDLSLKENKIIFIITILTAISFIFSLFCVRNTEENYHEEIQLKYIEERNKFQNL